MIRKFYTYLLILSGILCSAQNHLEITEENDLILGKSIQFESRVLEEQRAINVYLPESYKKNQEKKYPVIYLLDGSIDEDFIHIAGIVQFGSFSWIQMVPETIVVGISNIDRKRDFTYPSENELDQTEFPTSGGSSNFIKFLETELQPFVASNFRTTSTSTLIGQSLGGLLATEILFTKPDLFTNYIIVSPSLWWDNEELLNKEPITSIKEKSIYIAGGKEGAVMERLAKELFEKILNTKEAKTRVYYDFLEDKDHGDALHIATYKALEQIFRSEK